MQTITRYVAISDHEVVHVAAVMSLKYQKPSRRQIYLWNKVNFDEVRENRSCFCVG